mgnify:CR=1 FL=1
MYLEWFFKEKAAGEKSLEEVVVDLLAERKLHVTTAESCIDCRNVSQCGRSIRCAERGICYVFE